MIDLRSDTVTRLGSAMLAAMMNAETGDDVYGEDPTVNALEAKAAAMTGKEAGLFVTSGTQGNLLALLSHCQRGDEYIAGQDAHTYRFEAGGGAVLGGIQPQPLPFNERGEITLDELRPALNPANIHFARTRLLCLENTQAGKILSMAYLEEWKDLADQYGLARHLDGARVFNAAVGLDIDVRDICKYFDSVSFCLSKGLGCPAGSVLVGDASLIQRARRWRKMLGGGMRQAGILAAAGIYALDHHIDRLREDHANAAVLGEALQNLERLGLAEPVQTNMVMVDCPPDQLSRLRDFLAERDIRITSPRWVLHMDVSREDVEQVIDAVKSF
ncbi:MAG: low-specificity L-threonine aldolase [Pseudomonadales bacterium]|nr:low-specificity L-threonine aldolase [Pseudomonadales bacterium]